VENPKAAQRLPGEPWKNTGYSTINPASPTVMYTTPVTSATYTSASTVTT